MNQDTSLLTRYISAWGYHILAFMSLLKAVSFLIVQRYVWMIGMAGVVIVCEAMALWRKRDVENAEG